MKSRNPPFSIDEWYHCFNRGIDKRVVFEDPRDYHRFLELLYLANDEYPLKRNDIGNYKLKEILSMPRGKKLVSIGAFCLMPNHFHLVLKEVREGGITAFMRKIGTAYTMYFNTRYERNGNLFLKPFNSNHVPTDRYFQHLINYVHSNPSTLYEPRWKENNVVDPQFLEEQVTAYPYSSLGAYVDIQSPMRPILDEEVFSIVRMSPMRKILQEARQYYIENSDLP